MRMYENRLARRPAEPRIIEGVAFNSQLSSCGQVAGIRELSACSMRGKVRSAGVPARNSVSGNRLSGHDGNAKPLLVGTPRRGVRGGLGETALPGAHLARARTFALRAKTPALPTRLLTLGMNQVVTYGLCWVLAAVQAFCGEAIGPWDRAALYQTPSVFDAAEFATNDVRTVFYEGKPYQGRPTRVFAYYGLPAGASPARKVPGIVLIHGGGGSAFVRWVKLWNSRGYAAISMDTCGADSGNAYCNEQKGHRRHAWAGPPGWGGFDKYDDPVADQWTYHAVAAAVSGHSLLRSQPEVDTSRIGVTGISWGGYLTCIAAAVDDRFAFAVPVYGCGFLGENSAWLDRFQGMTKVNAEKWLGLWDPSVYLPHAKMPFLWVTGSNDFAYPMDSLQKSYCALKVPHTLCVRLRMPHGHGAAGENPAEILAFADSVTRGGQPLPAFTRAAREGRTVRAAFIANGRAVARAELNSTTHTGRWQERVWQAGSVALNRGESGTGTLEAELPEGSTVWYFNLFTDDGLCVSSQHEELGLAGN